MIFSNLVTFKIKYLHALHHILDYVVSIIGNSNIHSYKLLMSSSI